MAAGLVRRPWTVGDLLRGIVMQLEDWPKERRAPMKRKTARPLALSRETLRHLEDLPEILSRVVDGK
jgi:hypothetical protein